MTYNELWRQLVQIYDEGEAKAIARMVYEERFGLTLSDIYLGRETQLSADDQTEMQEIAKRLLQGEPIQYVLGQADFCGHTFRVNERVLIPRPETEELCRWIMSEVKDGKLEDRDISILDIGTGSGCIANTLAAELPQAQLTAWDISEEALDVARENAKRNHVSVRFEKVDVLNMPHSSFFVPHFSLIVSNPPYICDKEREAMAVNVLALKQGGWLYFEINPLYAEPLCDMLCDMRFCCIETKTDQYGKQRMTRARKALR